MKVAVLGATGLLGQHTARALRDRGHELVVLHRASSRLEGLRALDFEARLVDLDDAASLVRQLRGLDGLIHCAGYYPTAPEPWQREVAIASAQMRHVLDAAQTNAIGRIVYVGSSIALKRRADGRAASEQDSYEDRPRDRAPYLQVKYELDRAVRERARAGLPVTLAIPAWSFGEYDAGPTTGRLIVEIANRKLPAFIPGRRNVIYAGDAARGIVLALEKGRAGERYLLTHRNLEMAELVRLIAEVAAVEPPRAALPLPLARSIGRLQELRYRLVGGDLPGLSSTAIALVSSGQYLDGAKAQRELGFESRVSIEEAVLRALRWFRAVGYVKPRVLAVPREAPPAPAKARGKDAEPTSL